MSLIFSNYVKKWNINLNISKLKHIKNTLSTRKLTICLITATLKNIPVILRILKPKVSYLLLHCIMHSDEQMAIGLWHCTYRLAKREMVTCETSFKTQKDNLRDHPIPCHHYARIYWWIQGQPYQAISTHGKCAYSFCARKRAHETSIVTVCVFILWRSRQIIWWRH